MEGEKTLTETKTSVTRKGDLVTVKTIETTTVTKPGKDPKVTTKEKVEKYEGKDGFDRLPEELRKQLDDASNSKTITKPINKTAAKPNFEKELLEETNKLREAHGASPLKHCDKASKYALERATAMAKKDEMVSRPNNDYGENVSCMWSNDPEHKVDADEIVKRWYDESAKYDYDKEPTTLNAGHFTQLVWKDSKKFGAAAVKSDSNKIYVVAAYDPPGNWTGEFKKNVSARKSGVAAALRSFIKKKTESSSSSSEDEDEGLEKFNKDGLKSHNAYRKKHGVPALKHSSTLEKYAQEWADHLASHAKFEHRTNNRYGENLYTYHSSSGAKPSAEDACQSWYSEIRDHTFGKEPTSLKTGHFTQLVWKGSKEVGMGIAKGSRGWVVVANYDPPGNLRGTYASNVPAPM